MDWILMWKNDQHNWPEKKMKKKTDSWSQISCDRNQIWSEDLLDIYYKLMEMFIRYSSVQALLFGL